MRMLKPLIIMIIGLLFLFATSIASNVIVANQLSIALPFGNLQAYEFVWQGNTCLLILQTGLWCDNGSALG